MLRNARKSPPAASNVRAGTTCRTPARKGTTPVERAASATERLSVTNPDGTVSCRSDSHASWDRSCPTFQRKCTELDARLLENLMPYFPTEETWTHISQPPKALALPPPATQIPAPQYNGGWETVEHHRGRYRQTTLPYGRRTPDPPADEQTQRRTVQPQGSPATSSNRLGLGPTPWWGDTDGDNGLPPSGRH